MITFKDLALKNVVIFKAAKLAIAGSGLTLVTGRNQDGAMESDSDSNSSSNGSGKSLLLASIANLLYDSPPLSNRKSSRKDILSKNSSITLNLEVDGDSYSIVQGSSKYQIFKNGEDLQVRTLERSKQILKEICSLQDFDFYSTVYLSTQRPQAFLFEADSKRSGILTDLFRFGVYDSLRQHFADKLRLVKRKADTLSDLRDEMVRVRLALDQNTWSAEDELALNQSQTKAEKEVYPAKLQKVSGYVSQLSSFKQLLIDFSENLSYKEEVQEKLSLCLSIDSFSPELKTEKPINLKKLLDLEIANRRLLSKHKQSIKDFSILEKSTVDSVLKRLSLSKQWITAKLVGFEPAIPVLVAISKDAEAKSLMERTRDMLKRTVTFIDNVDKSLSSGMSYDATGKWTASKKFSSFSENIAIMMPIKADTIAKDQAILDQFGTLVSSYAAECGFFLREAESFATTCDDIPESPLLTGLNSFLTFIRTRIVRNKTAVTQSYAAIKANSLSFHIENNIKASSDSLQSAIHVFRETETIVSLSLKGTTECPLCGESLHKETMDKLLEKRRDEISACQFLRECYIRIESIEGIVNKMTSLSDKLTYVKSLPDGGDTAHINDFLWESLDTIFKKVNTDDYFYSLCRVYLKSLFALLDGFSDELTHINRSVEKLSGLRQPYDLTLSDGPLKDLSNLELRNLGEALDLEEIAANKLDRSKLAIAKAGLSIQSTIKRSNLDIGKYDLSKQKDFSLVLESIDKLSQFYHKYKYSLTKNMTVLNNRIVKLSTRKNTYSLYSDKQSELQDRIQELELEVADAEILNSLVAAYSGKGLRNVALQHVATVLQDNLNTFSGLLYGEDIKFQIISTESGVSAKAIRGKDSVSDIRMLSGSESDAFSLIFLLSILSLTPSNRRSNFVVLDEMDSHMDDAMRTRFYTGYLATLKTVIPNIFVITPRDTGLPDVKFDKVVRVIKQNGTSKVLSKVYK